MMKEVKTYQQLQTEIEGKEKTYLLLYKKGTEKSNCAYNNISTISSSVKEMDIYYADVNSTRDIHTVYGIKSVPTLVEFENGALKNLIKGCNDSGYYQALFEDAVYYTTMKKDDAPQKRVTVYSTPTCSWCNTLKSYLKKHKIRFTDINVAADQRVADELVKRSGQMGVPQTDINGEIIVGFNKSRINELLGIK